MLAWLRFARFLVREFRAPALLFACLVLAGGLLLKLFYHQRALSYPLACYAVFCMVFFDTGTLEFPNEWYLQPLFFLVPVIGLCAVADSVVRLGYFLVTAKRKLQEWHRMNASLMRDHIVVCGVGKVGYRVLEELLTLREDVVAIDNTPESEFVTEMIEHGVPVIIGEVRLRRTLEAAGVRHARACILVTDDDLANIDAALTAREINPGIRVVVRLFDETLASKVGAAFDMPAISTSSSAASAFVAAATERHIFQSFQLGTQRLHVADLLVEAGSKLAGRLIGEVQHECEVNIVMHLRGNETTVNPPHSMTLEPGDRIVCIAPIAALTALGDDRRQ